MKTILCIDGGGMKGYIPCYVLAQLEAQTGQSCADMFDLFAGTSIGGIMACLIANGGSATNALTFFTTDGPAIFGKQRFFGVNGIIRPRYSNDQLQEVLKARLGDARLSTLKKSLLVPAFDLASYQPYFFKAPNIETDYALWQVGMATSAAQTYFPAFELDGKVLWDGGNVANNPTLCAVAEAMRMWPGERLRVLSLCCGTGKSTLPPKLLVNAGIVRVGLETLNLLLDANDELPDYILRHVMASGYFRIEPDSKALPLDGASAMDLSNLFDAAKKCADQSAQTLEDFLSYGAVAPSTERVARINEPHA